MKKWRRSASIAGSGATGFPPVAPVVIAVTADPEDGIYVIQFDQPVTVGSPGTSSLMIGGIAGVWDNAGTTETQAWDPLTGIPAAGLPWLWTGPDPSLSPQPSLSQTGTTT